MDDNKILKTFWVCFWLAGIVMLLLAMIETLERMNTSIMLLAK